MVEMSKNKKKKKKITQTLANLQNIYYICKRNERGDPTRSPPALRIEERPPVADRREKKDYDDIRTRHTYLH